jgi:hypothetical protein
MLQDGIETASSLRETTLAAIDEAVRSIFEAQMIVVSFTTSVLNYTLTDTYYDAGMASPISGMPKVKFSDHDARVALREAWSPFSPLTRMNLDTRYRFIRKGLLHPAEQELWSEIEVWSEYKARDHFERQHQLSSDWAVFALALAEGDKQQARRIINDI